MLILIKKISMITILGLTVNVNLYPSTQQQQQQQQIASTSSHKISRPLYAIYYKITVINVPDGYVLHGTTTDDKKPYAMQGPASDYTINLYLKNNTLETFEDDFQYTSQDNKISRSGNSFNGYSTWDISTDKLS